MSPPELADALGASQAGRQTLSFRRKGKGPTLVLVHGFLGGSAMWRAQLRAFAATRDVVCPDLAGFGGSATQCAPDKVEGHARMVLDLLDGLGITEFDLLGHSMGGMVVQEMARLAPQGNTEPDSLWNRPARRAARALRNHCSNA